MTTLTAVAALALAVSGCSGDGGGDDGAGTQSPSASAGTSTGAPADPGAQQRYLATAHRLPVSGSVKPVDADLLAYPQRWCGELGLGHDLAGTFTPGTVVYPMGSRWMLQPVDARKLLAAGVASYCPQFSGQVAKMPAPAATPATSSAPTSKLTGQCRFLTLDEVAEATGTRPYEATESMGFCLYLADMARTAVSVAFGSRATDIGTGKSVSGVGGEARWDANERSLNVRTHGGVLSVQIGPASTTADARGSAVSLVREAERRLP
ncbi:hypothetical protein [Streptomyces sp. NPDC020917]|uniref:hypothetical protein n=1 Tax=Streptomyces sp. NPDC020917 TaxID=3365102 RepID=UPI0037B473D9